MKNIICIDLRDFNYEKLMEVSKEYNINYDMLVENKRNDFARFWVDVNTNVVIAFTTKKNNQVVYTDQYTSILNKIEPVRLSKILDQYDVDSILEKINNHGLASLSKKELDFLRNR